eukprot:7948827-Lingulodinium_polyedra.AAC.1
MFQKRPRQPGLPLGHPVPTATTGTGEARPNTRQTTNDGAGRRAGPRANALEPKWLEPNWRPESPRG